MKLIADVHLPFVKDYFAACTQLVLKPGRAITAADLRDADALLVRSVTHVDEKLLANSSVKFVGSVTAGADHLDITFLETAGIAFQVASGFNAPPVADYVISVIAALQKKKLLMQKKIRAAVIGVGHVGKLVVQRLRDLQWHIVLCDPVRAQNETDFISTALSDLHDLDFITLHVPLVKSGQFPTHHFIDQTFLRRQNPGCVLLNASRGAVIHTKDLLDHGRHLSWCLDVWEHEPRINQDVLAHATLATPHMAGYSVQSKMRGMEMMYQAMCEQGLFQPPQMSPCKMPVQRLTMSGIESWQDIVLGLFDPEQTTRIMRSTLLSANDDGHLFDDMRHQFYHRFEFGYTEIRRAQLSRTDQGLLEKWGLKVSAD